MTAFISGFFYSKKSKIQSGFLHYIKLYFGNLVADNF